MERRQCLRARRREAVTLSGAQGWMFLRCKWEGNRVHVVFDSPNVSNVSLRPDSHQLIAASFNKTSPARRESP
ncbi:MAG TPA: hypothetical protein VFX14_23240 [Methylomirabilota bacterium]|nr:hypothetical protein [Methylomirabilota bacterium]